VATNPKSENFEKVMESTLSFIASRGLDRVTVASIARLSKVSRTWIYKYIGSSKESLIRNATLHIGKVFSEVEARPEVTNKEQLIASLYWGNRQFVSNLQKYPWIPRIFFQYGHTKNLFGAAVQEVLGVYFKILVHEMESGLSISKKEAVHLAQLYTSMRMGAGHWWTTTADLPLDMKQEEFLIRKLDLVVSVVLSDAGLKPQ
jgi:AcrR family transcriptional regulator